MVPLPFIGVTMRRSSIRPLLAVVVAVSLASASGCSSATVKGTAAGIVTEPADATVKVGSPASFTVQATGDAPLAYQWRRNGTAIEGAGGKSYTILAAALTDSGATFSVVVKNAAGSAQSREALLTVTASAPVLTRTCSA